VAIGIASPLNLHEVLFWIHYELAGLLRDGGWFDDAHSHIERAKSHTAGSAYSLGHAMELQALVWCDQNRHEEARSEALRAADVYDKLGAAGDAERCGRLLQDVERELNPPVASSQSG